MKDTTPLLADTEDQQEEAPSEVESSKENCVKKNPVPRSTVCLSYTMEKLRKVSQHSHWAVLVSLKVEQMHILSVPCTDSVKNLLSGQQKLAT